MKLTRREVMKSGMAVPAAAAAGTPELAAQTGPGSAPAGLRERLLLDFGWRFHFGHANDAAKDFGFGAGRSGGFQKTGGFLSPSNLAFDDSDWKPVDLPHDWAIELPFKMKPTCCFLSSSRSTMYGSLYDDTSGCSCRARQNTTAP